MTSATRVRCALERMPASTLRKTVDFSTRRRRFEAKSPAMPVPKYWIVRKPVTLTSEAPLSSRIPAPVRSLRLLGPVIAQVLPRPVILTPLLATTIPSVAVSAGPQSRSLSKSSSRSLPKNALSSRWPQEIFTLRRLGARVASAGTSGGRAPPASVRQDEWNTWRLSSCTRLPSRSASASTSPVAVRAASGQPSVTTSASVQRDVIAETSPSTPATAVSRPGEFGSPTSGSTQATLLARLFFSQPKYSAASASDWSVTTVRIRSAQLAWFVVTRPVGRAHDA